MKPFVCNTLFRRPPVLGQISGDRRFDAQPQLGLVIHSSTWLQLEQRTRWADGKVQRIEKLIGEFVAGLMRTAILERRQEEARKQQDRLLQKPGRAAQGPSGNSIPTRSGGSRPSLITTSRSQVLNSPRKRCGRILSTDFTCLSAQWSSVAENDSYRWYAAAPSS